MSVDGANECIICCVNVPDTLLMPCGHDTFCHSCIASICLTTPRPFITCPMCRSETYSMMTTTMHCQYLRRPTNSMEPRLWSPYDIQSGAWTTFTTALRNADGNQRQLLVALFLRGEGDQTLAVRVIDTTHDSQAQQNNVQVQQDPRQEILQAIQTTQQDIQQVMQQEIRQANQMAQMAQQELRQEMAQMAIAQMAQQQMAMTQMAHQEIQQNHRQEIRQAIQMAQQEIQQVLQQEIRQATQMAQQEIQQVSQQNILQYTQMSQPHALLILQHVSGILSLFFMGCLCVLLTQLWYRG